MLTFVARSQPGGGLNVSFAQRGHTFAMDLDPPEVLQMANTIWQACETAFYQVAARGPGWTGVVEITFADPDRGSGVVVFVAELGVWERIAALLTAHGELALGMGPVAGHA
jgi:hypothetical protein